MEYLGKALRNELVERALALDIWIGRSEMEIDEALKVEAQTTLRTFVILAKAEGSSIVRSFYFTLLQSCYAV